MRKIDKKRNTEFKRDLSPKVDKKPKTVLKRPVVSLSNPPVVSKVEPEPPPFAAF